jgi:transcriptional regulator GlxA family with amidase domain
MRKVAVIVEDGVEAFGLGTMCEVWNEPYRPEDDNPVFDFLVAAPGGGTVRCAGGYDITVDHDLDAAADADLVCIAPKRNYRTDDQRVLELLRSSDARGAEIFAHCTAAFTVGAAGLLDDRACTTHWRYAGELAAQYPAARVEPDRLYVRERNLTTGAGAAAGLDAALHLLREFFGAAAAATAARRIVVPPHRDGGQSQFIERAVPECESEVLRPVLDWVVANLEAPLDVATLAQRAHMSARTFARRFREEVGTTPHQWVTHQRVAAAEALLERTERPVEQIAAEVGFGNAQTLRHHFTRVRGVSPAQYRKTFCPVPVD